MNRREWIKTSGLAAMATLLSTQLLQASGGKKNPHIVLVSGWQTVNIGDIAHTPGMIKLLNDYLPEARISLWPKDIHKQEEYLLLQYFPKLNIVYGKLDKDGNPVNEELKKLFADADFMLHGSGPGLVGLPMLSFWSNHTRKPFGFFGVTIAGVSDEQKAFLNKASFIYTRETASLQILKQAGVSCKYIDFAPDATFALHIQNKEKAEAYMQLHALKSREFLCVVPRLRRSPYHRIHSYIKWDAKQIAEVTAENQKYVEPDHAKLREVMIRWIHETGKPVVLCPEMEYQTELFEPYLYNPLPDELKPYVVMHPYWLPDEAASLYKQAAAVVSIECHSPIIAIANGTPAFYMRQPSDTIKGQMYYDLELTDWVFEIDETTGTTIADRLMEVHRNYPAAEQKTIQVIKKVNQIYSTLFTELKKII